MKEKIKKVIVPAVTEVDFFIPEDCCPEQRDEKSFPSPSTELTEELALKIENANRLLLSLALDLIREDEDVDGDSGPGEDVRRQGMRAAFDGLIGQEVCLQLECAEEENGEAETDEEAAEDREKHVTGRVLLSGRDFALLHHKKDKIAVPYENIRKIKLSNRFAEAFHERTLDDIDPEFRRCLTFRFGEVVAGSPELIHTFFGLTLQNFLLKAVDHKIKVIFNDKVLEGILDCLDTESITICKKDKEITFETLEACYYIFPDCDFF